MNGRRIWVKICGVTRADDAERAVAAGADAIGLNFVAASPRVLGADAARAIADRVRGRCELVGVIADLPADDALRLRDEIGLDWLQLHGHEAPADLAALLPRAYKAVRIADAADVEHARGFAGTRLLVQ